MTGFKSTADPRFIDSYTVTTVQAMAPCGCMAPSAQVI
jgi:hypothetical protein